MNARKKSHTTHISHPSSRIGKTKGNVTHIKPIKRIKRAIKEEKAEVVSRAKETFLNGKNSYVQLGARLQKAIKENPWLSAVAFYGLSWGVRKLLRRRA